MFDPAILILNLARNGKLVILGRQTFITLLKDFINKIYIHFNFKIPVT